VSSPAVPPPPAVASFLAGDERLERCPPNESYAEQVLERIVAEEVEDMLHAAAQGRWRKANTYGYDGARKAIEAWLLMFGWRVRAAPGAHAAVVEVADRWLSEEPAPGPRIARSFSAARKARHDDEYPSPTAPERTKRELRALTLDSARLINETRTAAGLQPVDGIVPTDALLHERPERRPGN
jgi:hypothetical protein